MTYNVGRNLTHSINLPRPRLRGLESGHQITSGAFGDKELLVRVTLVQFTKLLHQRMKSKHCDGENCETETDFYGCLAPT